MVLSYKGLKNCLIFEIFHKLGQITNKSGFFICQLLNVKKKIYIALLLIFLTLKNKQTMGALVGASIGVVVVFLAIVVFAIVCQWKVYAKAGQPGWACIVPIYNLIVLLQIVNKPVWWIILMLIPIVNIVIIIIVLHRLSLSFGKGGGFTLGLLLLNIIFWAILAFDNSVYKKLES
jgi:hypothetical protein